jgi:hypothetical protein
MAVFSGAEKYEGRQTETWRLGNGVGYTVGDLLEVTHLAELILCGEVGNNMLRRYEYVIMSFALSCCFLVRAQDGSGHTASARKVDLRIGFTISPDSVTHQGNEGLRAAMVDTAAFAPKIKLLDAPSVPVGTEFAGWLRDGNIMLTATHVLYTPPCRPEWQAGNLMSVCFVVPLVVDTFVVDPASGKVKVCVTCDFHKDQNRDYLYSQVPQPVYNPPSTKNLAYYVVATHRGPVNAEGTGTITEMWKVDPTGRSKEQLLKFSVGMHGCQVSPNGDWLACEPSSTDACKQTVLLVELKTNKTFCIRRDDQISRDSSTIWSPDGKGFVYFSQTRETHPKEWSLNYYAVDSRTRVPTLNLAKGTLPSYFCNNVTKTTEECPRIGRSGGDGPIWSPCATEAPCPNGVEDSKWIFFSAYHQPTKTSPAREVIGKVSLDNPAEFKAITSYLGKDSGHPSISSDGSRLAFLVAESHTDRRGQLYVMRIGSPQARNLTSFDVQSFANATAPQWPGH